MRKRIIAMISVLVIFIIGVYFFTEFRQGDFSKISGIHPSEITRISVQTDWGENKIITSKTDIIAVTGTLDSAQYRRNEFQPEYTGYLYTMSFYKTDLKEAEIILGHYPIINGKKYTVSGINLDKIEKVVGLYPPKH